MASFSNSSFWSYDEEKKRDQFVETTFSNSEHFKIFSLSSRVRENKGMKSESSTFNSDLSENIIREALGLLFKYIYNFQDVKQNS